MSLTSALSSGQRAAERQMTDTFTALSPNGTTKDADNLDVNAYANEGTVKGKVSAESRQGGDTEARTVNVGGTERLVLNGGLHIPITAPVPTAGEYGEGWEYECTAVGALSDLALLGSRWLVVDVPLKSHATARRLDVVRIA